LGW
jgi:hypothetical protein